MAVGCDRVRNEKSEADNIENLFSRWLVVTRRGEAILM